MFIASPALLVHDTPVNPVTGSAKELNTTTNLPIQIIVDKAPLIKEIIT